MKKFLTVILAALVLTCGAACGSDTGSSTASTEETTSSTRGPVGEESSADEESLAESEEESEVESEEESEEESSADEESEAESEAEIDVSGMSNPIVMGSFAANLPDGYFIEDEEASVPIAYPEEYPDRVDNFTFTSEGSKQDISDYTQEALEELYSSLFDSCSFYVYEKTTCNGFDALRVEYTLTYSDVDMYQKQYMVFTDDDLYIVTFTSTSTDYDSEFEEVIDSIVVE